MTADDAREYVNNLDPRTFEVLRAEVNRRYSHGVTVEASRLRLTMPERMLVASRRTREAVQRVRVRLQCSQAVAKRAVELHVATLGGQS